MRSSQARILESTTIRENLFGFGKSTLTCLPAIAAEKGRAVLAVEGAVTEPGKESEAALPKTEAGRITEASKSAIVGAVDRDESEGPAIPDSFSW